MASIPKTVAPPRKILLIEDNPDDAFILQRTLQRTAPDQFDLIHVGWLGEALLKLRDEPVDLILADLSLPDGQGLEVVEQIRHLSPDIPVVVLTGNNDETLGLKALKVGVQDYLIKGQVDGNALMRSIRYAMERHQLVQEIEDTRVRQIKTKDEFLSHVSHELRSPLTAIYQYVTILLDGLAGELKPDQLEYLGIVLRNTVQLKDMIEDLLFVTRTEAGKLNIEQRKVLISESIFDVVNSLHADANAGGKSLTANVPSDMPPVYADPERLFQIVTNLVGNALKFTQEGGAVAVKVHPFSEDGEFICVEVSDNGCGISPEGCQRIFERLKQESQYIDIGRQGLGLGLFICKELVNRHGGQIWAESELGEGSRFFFTIPTYSLARQIFPAITEGHELREAASLLSIRIVLPNSNVGAKVGESVLRETWNTIRKTILPDRDVLLPRGGPAVECEVFHLITPATREGVEAMGRRIAESLEKLPIIKMQGLNVMTKSVELDLPSEESGLELDEIVENVANQIVEWIGSAPNL